MAQEKTCSDHMQKYFDSIEKEIQTIKKIANAARKKGYDPEDTIDIPQAKNMAERVIGLVSAAAPQIAETKVAERIQELEKKYGVLDWRVSLIIAEEIAKEKHCKFKDKKEAIEIGIRAGFAYHTLGTVASPLEGLVRIEFGKTNDGKEYFDVYFAGPIRSAGGTGASVCVLISDYVRKKLGYAQYDPSEKEVNRFVSELYDYHERITNLQYLPSPEEINFLAKNIPVQVNGEPSEKIEVSNYKDLERVQTNQIRNGVCLVMGEGIAQKAPKLWKQLSKWGKDFDMEHWSFLEEFLKVQKSIKAKEQKEEPEKKNKEHENDDKKAEEKESKKIKPDYTFIKDLVAGRPVLTHPLANGGFRLRYGRARTTGYSSAAIHPSTMHLLNDFIGIGTQLKVERPGKGCTVSSCDTLEGPIVRLEDGSVKTLNEEKEAKELKSKVTEILYLGDMLFTYGDFLNRAHTLVPPGYCEEWWSQEIEKAIVDTFGSLDRFKASDLLDIKQELLEKIIKEPIKTDINAGLALNISEKLGVPIHPKFTYPWNSIDSEQLVSLLDWLESGNIKYENDKVKKIIIPLKQDPKRHLELLGIPHEVINNEFVVIDKENSLILFHIFRIKDKENIKKEISGIRQVVLENKDKDVLKIINKISKTKIRDKLGISIGARMGRPEKSKIRKLTGSPHVLFPVGNEGGRLRCFQAAFEKGSITGEFPTYFCEKCKKNTIFSVCEKCNQKTKKMYYCKICGDLEKKECEHGKAQPYKEQKIDINYYFNETLKKTGSRNYPDLIKGVRGTSNKEHIPEHLLKGILRAKNSIYVNKDGTIRYDMTQMPITHFKPKEIGTPIERLKQIGYIKDIYGEELTDKEQILEIKPQDIILPASPDSPDEGADDILYRTANFVDDLLISLYEQAPYYNLSSKEDLVGHLCLALAPHTSAAITTRIIGFSKTQGFFAHPVIHAATRRDCDGDEACVMLLTDALLNFSRQYLPAHRGATQDAPLVFTSKVTPGEVDDMIFDMDIAWKYPLEFYNACLEYKNPWDIDIKTFGSTLGTPEQYEKMGFTHNTLDMNKGVLCSSYKILPTMEEKLKGQMDIAEKVRAVKTSDVASLVIEKHFIRDIKGNLRKFSMQQFRCVDCNEKYRRPPLIGRCTKCGGKIIFTISEGSIIKYLEPSISLANKYNIPSYLKHSLELTKRRIEGVFGKEKEIQEGLGKWFG